MAGSLISLTLNPSPLPASLPLSVSPSLSPVSIFSTAVKSSSSGSASTIKSLFLLVIGMTGITSSSSSTVGSTSSVSTVSIFIVSCFLFLNSLSSSSRRLLASSSGVNTSGGFSSVLFALTASALTLSLSPALSGCAASSFSCVDVSDDAACSSDAAFCSVVSTSFFDLLDAFSLTASSSLDGSSSFSGRGFSERMSGDFSMAVLMSAIAVFIHSATALKHFEKNSATLCGFTRNPTITVMAITISTIKYGPKVRPRKSGTSR